MSKIVSAIDSLCRGVVSGIERKTETIVSARGPDHHSVHFLRRDVQSAINEAVCCCVGTSPVKSNQNTASALDELPSRGSRPITSGIVRPRYRAMRMTTNPVKYFGIITPCLGSSSEVSLTMVFTSASPAYRCSTVI